MNGAMVLLAVGTILVASLYFVNKKEDHGWAGTMVKHSTAAYPSPGLSHNKKAPDAAEPVEPLPLGAPAPEAHAKAHAESGTFFGQDPFKIMYYVSAGLGLIGILAAAWFHGPKGAWGLLIGNREDPSKVRMDAVAAKFGPIPKWAENKWYVDELYHATIVKPLLVLSHVFHAIDKLVVDGLVDMVGALPRWFGALLRPSQNGMLHGYATGMVAGSTVLVVLIVLVALL